ncbi:hypothetical protein [Streptomyces albipurpureus]|uniref:Uncharacterized protein n=1 Tax=Streptomyces albipurpureus TaxID=2897419 RepID=A0ABT0UIW6_9ACTN|nr:hypothetical protein [Streptomyces sp. CWNU-1]MCM2387550.1 hypothetical protein [Streptomyces sp. CWNU-1]
MSGVFDAFQERALPEPDFVSVRGANSSHPQVRLGQAHSSVPVGLGGWQRLVW